MIWATLLANWRNKNDKSRIPTDVACSTPNLQQGLLQKKQRQVEKQHGQILHKGLKMFDQ